MATKKKQDLVRKATGKVKSKAKGAVRKVAAKATRRLDRAASGAAKAPKKASRPAAKKSFPVKKGAAVKRPATKKASAPKKASALQKTIAPKKTAAARPASMKKAPAVTAAVKKASAALPAATALASVPPSPAVTAAVKDAAGPAPAVSVGQPAPSISLPGDDGKTHSLSEHLGKPVVLYFYPKDNTPGCTQEACDFRDNLGRALAKGAVVFGVSSDSVASHEKFRDKYQLNFPLLSDPSLEAHRAFGAWGKKSLYGREFDGTIRSTFLIDREGRIARIWPKVRVGGHADEVLSAIEALA